ncbi:MAG: tetratricopeptide repeat protein [Planctomycetes bacterium]|nr:tetratricopeptide repeat protein [Planctomycetota bacterium]MCC7063287.1 tetratricopeptide repeat protein [Planctomycetota bacterium]
MDLSKHLENAADAVKRRNFPLAIKIYGQVLQIQPDYGDARAGLRKALYAKVAQKPASKLTAIVVGGVSLLTAEIARLCGRHAAAARAYERYLALDPLAEGANLKLGNALQRAGLRRSALAVFSCYAEAQPRCLDACRAAGGLFYEQGKVKEALVMYEQALKIDPRDQESLKARKDLAAEGALRSSNIENAQSSRELIKDKEQQRQLERQERLQLSPEEIEAELEELENKLQSAPDDQKLLRRTAKLREMAKDLSGALDLLERLLQRQPMDLELQELTGDLRIRLQEQMVEKAQKRGDEAATARARKALAELRVAESRRRVERNPADFGARFQLGSSLLESGDTDNAIAELQQAVKDPRKKTEAMFLMGRAFLQKNLPELALGQFDKAMQAAGTGVLAKEALYEMGQIAMQLGKREDALRHFTRILEQDIGFRDVAQKVEQMKA